jgi:hypothetical protein
MIDYFGYERWGYYLSAAAIVIEDAYVALCLN